MLPTVDTIKNVLDRKDEVGMHAVGRALVHLLNRQTHYEATVEITRFANSEGFAVNDAKKGTGMAKFYKNRGFLTEKQIAYWQKPCRKGSNTSRIGKYCKQLLEVAIDKLGQKNCQIELGNGIGTVYYPALCDDRYVSKESLDWLKENIGEYGLNWHVRNEVIFVDTKENAVLTKLVMAGEIGVA